MERRCRCIPSYRSQLLSTTVRPGRPFRSNLTEVTLNPPTSHATAAGSQSRRPPTFLSSRSVSFQTARIPLWIIKGNPQLIGHFVPDPGRQMRVLGAVEKCSIQVKRRDTETHWPRCFVWRIDVKDQRNLALGILQPMKVNMEIHLPVCHLRPLTGYDACAPRGEIIPESLGTVVKQLLSVNYQRCQSSCVDLTFNMQHCTRCEVAYGNSKKYCSDWLRRQMSLQTRR
jgi:hypothetical protein